MADDSPLILDSERRDRQLTLGCRNGFNSSRDVRLPFCGTTTADGHTLPGMYR
jgi:hypothetical protein